MILFAGRSVVIITLCTAFTHTHTGKKETNSREYNCKKISLMISVFKLKCAQRKDQMKNHNSRRAKDKTVSYIIIFILKHIFMVVYGFWCYNELNKYKTLNFKLFMGFVDRCFYFTTTTTKTHVRETGLEATCTRWWFLLTILQVYSIHTIKCFCALATTTDIASDTLIDDIISLHLHLGKNHLTLKVQIIYSCCSHKSCTSKIFLVIHIIT